MCLKRKKLTGNVNNFYQFRYSSKKVRIWTKIKLLLTSRVHAIHEKFFFSSIFRVAFELFLPIFFACLYNADNLIWDSNIDIYANSVVFVWLFLFGIMTLTIIIVYFTHPKKYSEQSIQKTKFEVFLADWKDNHKISILDHFVFILRRVALSAIVIYKWNHGMTQTILFLSVWIMVLLWKIFIRSFRHWILIFQDILFEFYLWTIIAIYLKFTQPESEKVIEGTAHVLGSICFMLVMAMMLVSFFIAIIMCIKSRVISFPLKLF